MKHRSPGSSHRIRGAALLLALLVVTVLSTAAVASLRVASNGAIAARFALDEARATSTIESLLPELRAWAGRQQALPRVGTPVHPGTDGLLSADRSDWSDVLVDEPFLRVHAVDLSGRLPWRFAASVPGSHGDADGQGLAPEVRERAEAISRALAEVPPQKTSSTGGSFARWNPLGEPFIDALHPSTGTPGLPDWSLRSGRATSINIRTAPLDVLSAVIRDGGVDQGTARELVAARNKAGQQGELPAELCRRAIETRARFNREAEPGERRVDLTDRTDAYGVIVGLRLPHDGQGSSPGHGLGAITRETRWWVVVELAPPPPSPDELFRSELRGDRQGGSNTLPNAGTPGRSGHAVRWRITELRRIAP